MCNIKYKTNLRYGNSACLALQTTRSVAFALQAACGKSCDRLTFTGGGV